MNHKEISNAKQAAELRSKTEDELAALTAEREQIIEQSTERRLYKVDEKLWRLRSDLYAISRAESTLVGSSKPSERELEIRRELQENIHRERYLMSDAPRGLPARFIRADATEHYRAEFDQAKKEAEELRSKHTSNISKPMGQLASRIADLEAVAREWPEVEKLCQIGEAVAKLRVEREQLGAEREQLQAERRAAVLAG